MIDVNAVTNFDRTLDELLEFWLFSVVVAGKTASTQSRLLDVFVEALTPRRPIPPTCNVVSSSPRSRIN